MVEELDGGSIGRVRTWLGSLMAIRLIELGD
jgi:hypothetical protein